MKNLTEFQLYLAEQQGEVAKRIVKKLEKLGEVICASHFEFLDDEISDMVFNILETLEAPLGEYNEFLVFEYISGDMTFDELLGKLDFGGDREWVN